MPFLAASPSKPQTPDRHRTMQSFWVIFFGVVCNFSRGDNWYDYIYTYIKLYIFTKDSLNSLLALFSPHIYPCRFLFFYMPTNLYLFCIAMLIWGQLLIFSILIARLFWRRRVEFMLVVESAWHDMIWPRFKHKRVMMILLVLHVWNNNLLPQS